MMKTLTTKLTQSVARFAKCDEGNFGMMAAFSVAALVGGLACSVDMTNVMASKMRLQDTTDAIALMAAKERLETVAELQAAADAYFTINYPNNTGDRIVLESIKREGDTVLISATNTVDAYFAQIFGRKTLDARVNSTATYAQRNVDIALVLDTTGSMKGAKLTSLKSAATNLVTTLESAKNENLNIAVVPFAEYVNVGLSRRDAEWLDVPNDSSTTSNVCRWKKDLISSTNCRKEYGTCENDGVPYSCSWTVCDKVWGEPYQVCGPKTDNDVWHGCVGSRITPWHERVAYENKKITGLMDTKCGTEIQALTNNMTQVKSTISALNAKGKTYIPSGLMWGWRALDTNMPLTEAKVDPKTETDKALILMTDGDNTLKKNGVLHIDSKKDSAPADKITKTMCEDIKDADIMVYTIAYEITNSATKNMLSKCATSNSMYFDAKDAAQLNDAFEQIAESLNELRLTN